MKKFTSWLLVFVAAAMFSAAPSMAAGADPTYLNTEYSPGNVVLSLAFPSNSERQWSIDFSGQANAASDWMVRNLTGGMDGIDTGFDIINGGYELTHEQAYQAIVGSTRGTVVQAWADIANAYESPDLGFTDGTGRVTLWDKIVFTLNGMNFIHTPGYGVYTGELLFGTPYLHNLHTITGVGFVSSVDSAVMNVSGVSNQVVGKRLGELRSGGNKKTGFWTSPFATVHKEGERNGYAPFRYEANGWALGYDKAFGAFTVGGAAFYSRGRYDDKWSLDNGKSASDHYGLSAYGNLRHREPFSRRPRRIPTQQKQHPSAAHRRGRGLSGGGLAWHEKQHRHMVACRQGGIRFRLLEQFHRDALNWTGIPPRGKQRLHCQRQRRYAVHGN